MRVRSHNHSAGFTLIELMIVVAIVSIISSVAVVKTRDVIGNVQDRRRLVDLLAFHQGVANFYSDHEFFPVTTPGCGVIGFRGLNGYFATLTTKPICNPQGEIIYPSLIAALADYLPPMEDPNNRIGGISGYLYQGVGGTTYMVMIHGTPSNMHNFPEQYWNPVRCGGVPNAQGKCPIENSIIITSHDSLF